MPSTSTFSCTGKKVDDHGENFVPLLRITIFHEKSDTFSGRLRKKLRNGNLENPSKTNALFVWNPHPQEDNLFVDGSATRERQKLITLVVGVRGDVTPNHLWAKKEVSK